MQQMTDTQFQLRLYNALNNKKPFKNFNALIHNSDHRESWFAYKNEVTEHHVMHILKQHAAKYSIEHPVNTNHTSLVEPSMDLYANFDRSELPLISIYFTGATETDQNFDVYLNELGKNYEAKVPFSLIFELSKAPTPQLKYQLKQAAWMKENKKLIQLYCTGVAYVIPGKLLRGVLKFIFSIQKNPVDFNVFSDYEPAKAWALAKTNRQ